jgi:sarcosine oxidase, subunit gamma
MLDAAGKRQHALDALADAASLCAAAELRALLPMARFVFRGRAAATEAAGRAFGLPLPAAACRASSDGALAALWLGPDEWLLLAAEANAAAIARRFSIALAGVAHSLVDVSHRNVALTITGPRAASALNHGCPLDLSLAAFPVAACTRTILGKAEIVLWRIAQARFHVEIGRSFAAYVWRLLDEARRELEI